MGAGESTQSSNGQDATTSDDNEVQSGHFAVSISGDLVAKGLQLDKDLEAQLNRAYQQGKEDGLQNVHRTISAAAAQLYDNVHDHISSYQDKHIEHSRKLAASIEEKLVPPNSIEKACKSQESSLISCLESNKDYPLNCKDTVDAFVFCSNEAVQNK